MYLKSLTLRGFKSFASSTTLRFEPGITCVVGPNGSGKSNVVDALAWVMGEQGAKSLRGGKMEDVIFAGTASRPPLGRAEVILTIDNSDGALPIDYTEVTISRLMFRSGQSEYAINGEPCRLLDVQELLSDSGIGREMHVIIGQGMLDTALNSGPEGRRAVIEEAAGVLKHRKRKEKALRKLDAMQANLTRVQDLTAELRRQLKPLGQQAEIARKAAVIQAELRDARARLLADDLVTLRTRLEQEAADEAAVKRRRAEVEQSLAAAQEREAVLEAEEQAAAPVLARAQDTWFRLSSLRERLQGVANLAAERHRNASEDTGEERRGRDPEDMEREAVAVREQEELLRAALEEAQDQLSDAVRTRAEAEEALREEERRLQAAARAAADRREQLARLRGRVEALRSKAQAGESEIGRLAEARDDAARRAEAAQAEYDAYDAEVAEDPELVAEHETAQQALAAAKEAVEAARAAEDAPRQRLKAARQAVAAARAADQAAQKEVAALQARIEALELTLGSAADGGEVLLSSDLDGVLGTLASMLTVEPGYETAVAAALGDAAQAIAVGSLETARAALALLRSRDAGRAGLLVGGGGAGAGEQAVPGVRYAADVITVPDAVRPALRHLLRGVVVVDDLDAAADLVRRHPDLRAVTRDGDLLGAHWAQSGGAGGAQSLLEMRATLDEAVESLEAARERAERSARGLAEAVAAEQEAQAALEDAQAAVQQAQSGVNQAQAVLDRTRAKLREFEAQAAQEAKHAARLEAAVRAARGEVERLTKALDAAAEAREHDLRAMAELEARLAEAQAAAEAADDLGEDTDTRDELAERVHQARSAEMEARLAVRTAEERVQAIAGRADALERGARREREERARAAARRERRRRQARVARAVLAGTETALHRIDLSLQAAVAEREAAQQAKADREAELKVVRTQVRDLSTQLEKLVNVVHGSEVARAEQRLRLEQLEQRAMDEMGLEVDTLIAEYGPDQPVPPGPDAPEDARPEPYDRATVEKRAKAAERKLNQLGKVNPLALEEFAALEERHAFLNSQLEDLKKTRRDLLTVVKEVDDRVQKVFAEAFADTAREFERIFTRLFPGGEGRLILTDPDDMLNTGVEVEARPPGKKVKRLSLLSGGERSLVAIAILVAVFKARPSPFYVLDEVEAALDDTNTQRLLGILEELRENSQLIIITHQKRTMEGADALYGVSMRGDGVTQVISQRLRDRDHDRSPDPAKSG
ncbi:chromosome segregation protein SMC [Thermomonospora cellulosilytica]|uniref:Chromosome partition protein Smc n=1 Tax=Thermomonospora cellulosilytica TaxID=1411118 RepID=A0A7W3N3Z5_9ACTN|nr:chromosome segregation protein SMC [Thermomonospora cellulosilytica]MBA9007119.1 chromosome segregation protein [Thermomonospora cellulosilytica]